MQGIHQQSLHDMHMRVRSQTNLLVPRVINSHCTVLQLQSLRSACAVLEHLLASSSKLKLVNLYIDSSPAPPVNLVGSCLFDKEVSNLGASVTMQVAATLTWQTKANTSCCSSATVVPQYTRVQ